MLRRSALLVLPALALSLPGVHADAASYRWTTITSVSGGTLQSCRVPVASTDPWKLRFRVNGTRATTKVQGIVRRQRNGDQISGGWTSAYVRPGGVSGIAVVQLPRGSAYDLAVVINNGQTGAAKRVRPVDIPRC